MDRREFLMTSATVAAGVLPRIAPASAAEMPSPPPNNAPWRTFEVATDVEIWPQDVPARLWLPLPLYRDTDYQRTLDIRWSGNATASGIYRDPRFRAPAYFAEWSDRTAAPKLRVTTIISTRNRSVELSKPGPVQYAPREEIDLYLQPATHIPTDGIVRATASRILPTAAGNTLERARAIYEWI